MSRSLLGLLLLSMFTFHGAVQAQSLPWVDDTNFSNIVGQGGPAVVFFDASWCGACRSLDGPMGTLAARYGGRVQVLRMDVDSNAETPQIFGIRDLPTVVFFNHGSVAGRITGSASLDQLESRVQALLR
ncbi:thioredoxin family protein [Wenzhouxiangella marina]|uniref:thioredoxin family protein n=1 Tax=Wenzhouxiangella marina TaxID=1579979 RepID=UPI0009E47876|nr:thioredoxin family protein [Wenzhouxiangella marina]MBB6087269.1 thioredoxin 1 [Wenzhouxiangella marina]